MEATNTILSLADSGTLDVAQIFMQLLGGLAVFLFGMELMDDALKRVAGAKMKDLLAKLTTNRFTGAMAGTVTTMVVQSSSVTTVLVVGFISAGLMSLHQSIGVIMGANIGTTITAQIVAFKVTKYALWMVFIGFIVKFTSKNDKIQQYGLALLGLGLVFYGLTMMSAATKPLRSYQPFIDMLQSMSNPFYGILASMIFTGIVQSSSATTGIIIVLASQGFVTLEAGIALAFGANLGTCVTAMLAAIGKPREAVQAAVVHVLFNVGGVVLWFLFIPQLASFVTSMSPAYPDLVGTDRLAAETPRQIANAHTMFNVINTFIFIWLVDPFAKIVQWLVPQRDEMASTEVESRYLDALLLETPGLALEQTRLELGKLGVYVRQMVYQILPTVLNGTKEELETIIKADEKVDVLHGEIFAYLGQLSRENLLTEQSVRLSNYMAVANYIEDIGNRVKITAIDAGMAKLSHNVEMSENTQKVITEIHDKVVWAVEESLDALAKFDTGKAEAVIAASHEIDQMIQNAENHLTRRLGAREPNRAILFRIEYEIVEYLARTYYFAERIAQVAANIETDVSTIPDAEVVEALGHINT
ncbi:Na/Pi cotransporter family protein [Anaerolineales bacterium HSG6]|nr:Na/Pi cotransporter family protein [Anaerolineales bacterium HSG6]MDM8531000.1 Na/Pi cotransporter family protein [Anaerolineales bacterium HSG25]